MSSGKNQILNNCSEKDVFMLRHCSGYDADCFLMEPSISNEELVQLEFRNSTSTMIHNDNQVCVC